MGAASFVQKQGKAAKRIRASRQGQARRKDRMQTDGISTAKTIHNNSYHVDTFELRREKVIDIPGVVSALGQNGNTPIFYYLNPGNATLFPIFSDIAATYEQYRCLELYFTYETEAYAASGSAVSAGKIIMATDYNPDNPLFVTDTQMENYINSVRGVPYSRNMVHDVLIGPHKNQKSPLDTYFVYNSTNDKAPTGEYGKFYDIGTFQLGVAGTVSTAEIGELYVNYRFQMIKPVQPSATPAIDSEHGFEQPQGSSVPANWFGTSGLGVTSTSAGNIRQDPLNNNTIQFTAPGTYYLSFNLNATAGSISGTISWGLANASFINVYNDGGSGTLQVVSSSKAIIVGYMIVSQTVNTNNPAKLAMSGLTGWTAGSIDFFALQQNPAFNAPKPPLTEEQKKIEQLEEKIDALVSLMRIKQDYGDDFEKLTPKSEVSSSSTGASGYLELMGRLRPLKITTG